MHSNLYANPFCSRFSFIYTLGLVFIFFHLYIFRFPFFLIIFISYTYKIISTRSTLMLSHVTDTYGIKCFKKYSNIRFLFPSFSLVDGSNTFSTSSFSNLLKSFPELTFFSKKEKNTAYFHHLSSLVVNIRKN